MFDNYVFIYKNSINKWNQAMNPKFIARHTYCRAIPIKEVNLLFNELDILIDYLNEKIELKLNNEQLEFIKEYID